MNTEAIQALKQEIKAKQRLLEILELQEKQKENKSFYETLVGKKYLSFLSAVTTPFARTNEKARGLLNDPQGYLFIELMREALDISNQENPEKDSKQALKLANKCAKILLKLEAFEEKVEEVPDEGLMTDVVQKLLNKIKELRTQENTFENLDKLFEVGLSTI